MPNRQEHIARARDNEKLAYTLDLETGLGVDWAITMLFYSALHYIDAYLANAGGGIPWNHDLRDKAIKDNGSLSDLWQTYRDLKNLSQNGRYDIASYHKSKLQKAQEKLDIVKKHLASKGLNVG